MRRPLAVLALLIGCTEPAPFTATSQDTSPIIGGTPDTGDPAVVAVLAPFWNCSGTLIAPRVVLTAAHCIAEQPTDMVVFFGNDLWSGEGTVIGVVEAVANPSFDPEQIWLGGDVGLLALIEDAPAAPIPLAAAPAESYAGADGRIVGFGVSDLDTWSSGVKLEAPLTLGFVDGGTIFSFSSNPACFGDSGGPLFVTENGVEAIVGVMSFGDFCFEGNGHTRIDVWMDDFIAPFLALYGGTCEVPDATPPRLVCQPPIGCDLSHYAPRAGDSCGLESVTCAEGTCTAIDLAGNTASCTIPPPVDLTAPEVETRPIVLHPDGQLHEVSLVDCVTRVIDDCGGELDVAASLGPIRQVTSDEAEDALADGARTCGDIALVDDDTVALRAERSGAGDGRIYSIHAFVRDTAGNPAEATCRVEVPVGSADAVAGECALCAGSCFVCPTTSSTCGETGPPDRFRVVAELGAPAPGGGEHQNLFETYGLDGRGEALFATDITAGGQGLYIYDQGIVREVFRSGDPAPGGGSFGIGVWAGPRLSRKGEAAFAAPLEPLQFPFGLNSGVYRATTDGRLEAVVVPGATPAPGGGAFVGAFERTAIDAGGAVTFAGIVETDRGIDGTYGMGIYRASRAGAVAEVVAPGAAGPGGDVFDLARAPAASANGDIAFLGHLRAQPCNATSPQEISINCASALFVRRATGAITTIVGAGITELPGGVKIQLPSYPEIDRTGAVVFPARVYTDERGWVARGLLRWQAGKLAPVAKPGDLLPGGDHLLTVGVMPGTYSVNDGGTIAFAATIDADRDGDGAFDTGLYVWRDGTVRVVARTGTVIPGIGTVAKLQGAATIFSFFPYGGAVLNERGDVLFQVTTTAGRTLLLIASSG